MSNLLHSVFSRSRRQEPDALPEFQGHELERGSRSASQFNETPFPSPVGSPGPSSPRPSITTPHFRIQQGEHNNTGLNDPSISPSGSRPRTELTGRDAMLDVSNALQMEASETEDQRPESRSEPMSNGLPLPESSETPYGTNILSPSLVSSSPASSPKQTRRSRKFKHLPGFSFKISQLPGTSRARKFRPSRFNPSLVLENSGSVARDHLASERTFLAYVRTSLALASMGVAIVQLFTIADYLASTGVNTQTTASKKVQKFARPLGVTTVLLALIVLLIAVVRYFLVQCALPEKLFPVARFSVAFLAFSLGAIVVVIFAALLSGRTSS